MASDDTSGGVSENPHLKGYKSRYQRARSEDDFDARVPAKIDAAVAKAVSAADTQKKSEWRHTINTAAAVIGVLLTSLIAWIATANYFQGYLDRDRARVERETRQQLVVEQLRKDVDALRASPPSAAPSEPAPAVPKAPLSSPATPNDPPRTAAPPSQRVTPPSSPQPAVSPAVVSRLDKRQTRTERHDRVQDSRLNQHDTRLDGLTDHVAAIERTLGPMVTIAAGPKMFQPFSITTFELAPSLKDQVKQALSIACSVAASNIRDTPTGFELEAVACSSEVLAAHLPPGIKLVMPDASKSTTKPDSEIVPGKTPDRND